jgi:hypothetical protein
MVTWLAARHNELTAEEKLAREQAEAIALEEKQRAGRIAVRLT